MIDNNELEKKPLLKNTVICKRCGEEHFVQYGDRVLDDGTRVPDKTIAFYKCNDKIYLAGIAGREV
jgi:hypothetical protein